MTLRLHSRGARHAALLAVVALAFFTGRMIAGPWFALRGLDEQVSAGELAGAVRHDAKNPSFHYRLGLHRSYDPAARDLPGALNHLLIAISLNPLDAGYWTELSAVYEGMGDAAGSRRALGRAIALKPTDLKARWKMVNLKLGSGEADLAIPELGAIIRDYPKERAKGLSLLYTLAGADVTRIIEKNGLPLEAGPMRAYLAFLMRRDDTEGVKAMWRAINERFETDSKARLDYMDYLIYRGETDDAKAEWERLGAAHGGGGGLVWDGGFEEDFIGGGFGWRTTGTEGAEMSFDSSVSYDGRRSLRIEFDGRHNVDFHHVSQLVALEPSTRYVLKARMKADGITTTNGVFLELYGVGGCRFSGRTGALTGSGGWRELAVEATTPPGCNAGAVRVMRLKSGKFNNLIGGRVWIDEVSLHESHAAAS